MADGSLSASELWFPCLRQSSMKLRSLPPLCGWEDDPVQLAYPEMCGGANKDSLAAHQRAAVERFTLSIASLGEFMRSLNWQPLRA